MSDASPRRIAFLGFGLIAGSIARSLAATTAAPPSRSTAPRSGAPSRPTLVAWSPSNAGPARAVADGVLDASTPDPGAALEDADLVVLAAPPIETIELVARLGGDLRGRLAGDAVVTDVASTKAAIVASADRADLRFVGGHPMAGREVAGYDHATDALFRDRPWVVVPGRMADAAAIGRVEWLATACGARPVRLDAASHDAAAAAISHVPLVIAAALAEAIAGADAERPDWPAAAALAASGWRDMTRLARGDVRMGAGIVATNADAVAAGLREVRAAIDAWLELLAGDGPVGTPASGGIEARLLAVKERLERPPTGSS